MRAIQNQKTLSVLTSRFTCGQMSALTRLQRAVDDIKKTYGDYVAGEITNLKLAELVESNVRLARNLMEEIYPKDTVRVR